MLKNAYKQPRSEIPQSAKSENWERLWGRKGRFLCTNIFTPQVSDLWESLLDKWTFALKFQLYGENVVGLIMGFYIEFWVLLAIGF